MTGFSEIPKVTARFGRVEPVLVREQMRRLKNNVSWPEVMSKTGLSAGRVLAVFEGLDAGKDEETIARDYGLKLEKVKEVAAFFVEAPIASEGDENRSEEVEDPPSDESIRGIESRGS